MFKMKYNLVDSAGEKSVVTLSLTKGSWAKAFAPLAIYVVGLGVAYAYAVAQENKTTRVVELDPDHE